MTSTFANRMVEFNAVVASNTLPVTLAVNNLNALTFRLSPLVGKLNHFIANNETDNRPRNKKH